MGRKQELVREGQEALLEQVIRKEWIRRGQKTRSGLTIEGQVMKYLDSQGEEGMMSR